MSREIKFRAWSNEHNRYCDFVTLDENGKWIGWIKSNGVYLTTPDIVLEQDTGLKDKNSKEIYEGDIVQEEIDFNSKLTDGVFKYEVYWDNDGFFWGLEPIGLSSIHNELWETNQSIEVIGNIHENPELMEIGEHS